jgi:arylformamidase
LEPAVGEQEKNSMQLFDISVSIQADLPVWPGDPAVDLQQAASMAQGDTYNLSYLHMSAHSGTHIDAPLHFIDRGNPVGSIALERFIGPVQVISIPKGMQRIDANIIDQLAIQPGMERILFKTDNSALWKNGKDFYESYTALDSSGAQRLIDLGVHLVGIDYLSISVYDDLIQPHVILLSRNVIILEGCDLSGVREGLYKLICLPLKVDSCEGAPVRAILLKED